MQPHLALCELAAPQAHGLQLAADGGPLEGAPELRHQRRQAVPAPVAALECGAQLLGLRRGRAWGEQGTQVSAVHAELAGAAAGRAGGDAGGSESIRTDGGEACARSAGQPPAKKSPPCPLAPARR